MKLTTFAIPVGLGAALAVEVPPLPPAKVIVKPPAVHYFAVTAKDGTNESLYSQECAYTNVGKIQMVTVAWDGVPYPSPVQYTVYKGRETGVYTNSYAAGTNLALNVRIIPVQLTNVVVVITGTNLSWSTNAHRGPWAALNTNVTSVNMTNPIGRRFWRGSGIKERHWWQ